MGYIEQYFSSFMLYIAILFLCLLFAYLARHSNLKKIMLIFLIIALSLLPGLRGLSVGYDTFAYITKIIKPLLNSDKLVFLDNYYGFDFIVWVIGRVVKNPNGVLFVIALITNGLVVLRFWDYRKDISFVGAIFFYYCSYYLLTSNIFRQMLVVSIVFYATRYLEKGWYKTFSIITLLAMTIHSTALLGFGLLVFYFLSSNQGENSRKRQLIMLASPIVLSIGLLIVYRYFDYTHYFNLLDRYSEAGKGIGAMVPVKFLLLSFAFYYFKNKKQSSVSENNKVKFIFLCYSMGLIVSLLVMINSLADRFGLYYLIFEPLFWNLKISNKNLRLFARVIMILIGIYTICSSLNGNGQGIMPYMVCW